MSDYLEESDCAVATAHDAADIRDNPGPLSGLRIVDLTGSSVQYCAKLFAQLGADVLLIEPIDGCDTRRQGPFIDAEPHREKSLSFAYLNQGKRGICLNLDCDDGLTVLRQLAQSADVLVDSQCVAELEGRRIDYAALRAANPELIVTSVTPFGLSGPYANYRGDDLVAMALGGLLHLGGYPETEPVGAPGDQAWLAAAQVAAVATMAALWGRDGHAVQRGEVVEVSVQSCVVAALENTVQYVDLEHTVRRRTGGHQRQAGMGVFPCKDGLIYLMAGGVASNRFWSASVQWLIDVGAPGAEQLGDPKWLDIGWLVTPEAKQIFADVFLPYSQSKTKAELYEEAQRRRIPVCPVSTTSDLLVNRQLSHRQFFVETAHPWTGRRLTMPGAPYRFSDDLWQVGRPAPRLGEHTAEVLSGLGYTTEQQAVLLRAGAAA